MAVTDSVRAYFGVSRWDWDAAASDPSLKTEPPSIVRPTPEVFFLPPRRPHG